MEKQLRAQRDFISWFGLMVMLMLASAVSGHAQIKVVQAVPILINSTPSCTYTPPVSNQQGGLMYDETCWSIPVTGAVTVSFAPTSSADVLFVFGFLGDCTDNLGQAWVNRVPPFGGVTGGITSLTCLTGASSTSFGGMFYEISGVWPAAMSVPSQTLLTWDGSSSGAAVCPPSLGPNTITFFSLTMGQGDLGTMEFSGFSPEGLDLYSMSPPGAPSVSLSLGIGPGYVGTVFPQTTYEIWWDQNYLGTGAAYQQYLLNNAWAMGYQINGPADAGSPATISYTGTSINQSVNPRSLAGEYRWNAQDAMSGYECSAFGYILLPLSITRPAREIVVAQASQSVWPMETHIYNKLTLSFLAWVAG